MNSPRVTSDVEVVFHFQQSDVKIDVFQYINQLLEFIQRAHEAFKWFPNGGSQLFDSFVRAFKRQKSFKKDFANDINNFLGQLSPL